MSFKKDLHLLLQPFYWVNILLSLSYVTAKKLPFLCSLVFPAAECELDSRESEILFFLMIVVMLRTRKAGSVTMINYLSSSFIYAKVANLILWFYADVRMGIGFAILFVLFSLLLPEPTYTGPENITYFRTVAGLDEELERDKKVTWIVTFYTAWNPACVNFAPIFAQLSHEYNLDNLKFGKIDIGRYPDAAKKYRINDGASSQQLPTVILFKDGKESLRRPCVDTSNKLIRFFFTEDNIKLAFDLNNLYQHCKSNPLKKSKEKKREIGHQKAE
ncbi:Thioredoxin-related transmembrane protein 2-like protein [Frankliniella fusca]|uniref:Thioredoxin-related transmembrane protein 2-like protein n=1 Tax=Frankliniella fusca TaxID=407009 RepID=A0AAE1H3S7_9NEOP|nr:Thioredoxin-related transmembrane protein 2-like protein [Frankliniella fusca]